MQASSLFTQIEKCLKASAPKEKVAMTCALYESWKNGDFSLDPHSPILEFEEPGRPEKPELVAPKELSRRSPATKTGHAALIHSICHIEFNAINLALDAAYRFQDMPETFYTDWLRIAKEEAYHFTLLSQHLETLGFQYGDFSAHNGLWESALHTAHDPLVRMALVPRVLEARGLDVTPGIVKKLKDIKDIEAVDILAIIHHDEIGHVEAGSRWFRYLCQQRQLDAEEMFPKLLKEYMKGGIRGPFDHETRKKAGFSDEELKFLESSI